MNVCGILTNLNKVKTIFVWRAGDLQKPYIYTGNGKRTRKGIIILYIKKKQAMEAHPSKII